MTLSLRSGVLSSLGYVGLLVSHFSCAAVGVFHVVQLAGLGLRLFVFSLVGTAVWVAMVFSVLVQASLHGLRSSCVVRL